MLDVYLHSDAERRELLPSPPATVCRILDVGCSLGEFSPAVKAIDALIRQADFAYTDVGVLDRTHLRFSIRSNMIDMFTSTGYEVTSCTPIAVAGSRWASLVARLPWMPGDILAQQFVIVATLRSQTVGVAS